LERIPHIAAKMAIETGGGAGYLVDREDCSNPAPTAVEAWMSYHRLLETKIVDDRFREGGALIDYRGPSVPHFEPLDVREHGAWLEAMGHSEPLHDEARAAA
jgi:hypothetical protein